MSKTGSVVRTLEESYHVSGPFFFNETVTGAIYLKFYKNDLMPQLERIGEGKPLRFMQDGDGLIMRRLWEIGRVVILKIGLGEEAPKIGHEGPLTWHQWILIFGATSNKEYTRQDLQISTIFTSW